MRQPIDRNLRFVYEINLQDFVPDDHPLRAIKKHVDDELRRLASKFRKAYSHTGRPGVPPEQLLKALLLQALYSVRSEVVLVEMIHANLMFRWFLDLPLDKPVFSHDAFSDNRERLAKHRIFEAFFDGIVARIIELDLASTDHFSADGTYIRAHASFTSLRPIDAPDARVSDGADDDDAGNPTINFRGERRSNATHRSITDPEANIAHKGGTSMLAHTAHAISDNRHGFCLALAVTESYGNDERDAVPVLLDHLRKRHWMQPQTLGADAGYPSGELLLDLEARDIVPHIADKPGKIQLDQRDELKRERADARQRLRDRTGEDGYRLSQRCRKKIEEVFDWMKTIGGLVQTAFVGRWKIAQEVLIAGAAYNLVRLVNVLGQI